MYAVLRANRVYKTKLNKAGQSALFAIQLTNITFSAMSLMALSLQHPTIYRHAIDVGSTYTRTSLAIPLTQVSRSLHIAVAVVSSLKQYPLKTLLKLM